MYTIGQVAEMFGLPVSTLRYYDKQGLFPGLERASGIRRFGDTELEALRVIECLKKAGMEIKDIRLFMGMVRAGPINLPQPQGHVRGAEDPHGVGDREDEPRAGYAEVQMLVLRAGDPRWQRR